MKLYISKICLLLAGISLGVLLASAAQASEEDSELKNWHFEIMPYFSLPLGGNADVNINGAPSNDSGGSLGLSNGNVNAIVVARAEVWRKNIGFILDGRYMNIDFDTHFFENSNFLQSLGIASPTLHSEIKAGILDFFFSYRFEFHPIEALKDFRLHVEPQLGARWDIFDVRFNSPNGKVYSDDVNTWAELALGANIELWLTRGFSLGVNGNVSGFGLGDASNETWKITNYVGYRFPKVFGIYAGYQFFDIDKQLYSHGNYIDYNVFLHGPVLGLMFFY